MNFTVENRVCVCVCVCVYAEFDTRRLFSHSKLNVSMFSALTEKNQILRDKRVWKPVPSNATGMWRLEASSANPRRIYLPVKKETARFPAVKLVK